MTRTKVIIAVGVAIGLGACASTPSTQPAWYTEREATIESGYPSLQSVPRTNIANTDAAHWQAVQNEVLAAGQALKNNPRAEPATPDQDPAAFLQDAQQALEATRQSHE